MILTLFLVICCFVLLTKYNCFVVLEAAMSSVSTSTSSLEKSKLSHNDGTETALPELISAPPSPATLLLQDSSEEIPPQPLQEAHPSSTTPLLQDSLSKEMHDQKSASSKRLPPYPSFPDPPPSYHTLSNSMDSITSASSHQNDLGTGMHTLAGDHFLFCSFFFQMIKETWHIRFLLLFCKAKRAFVHQFFSSFLHQHC